VVPVQIISFLIVVQPLLISSLAYAQHAEPPTKAYVVEVTGEGSGGKQSTIAEVEQQAKQDAMRQAVEQAGVYLETETGVDMGMLTKDEIKSWSQGMVKVLEVLENKTDYDPKIKAFNCQMRIRAEVRTRDMSDLLERVKQDRTAQASSETPLSFEYSFLAQRLMADGSWAEVRVKDGSVLNSGDQFQISVRADRDCYAYVINQDASGAVYVLFPHEEAVSNALSGEREYALPDREKFYELDEVVGLETFYIAVSPTPMADLEWMINRIKKLGGDNAGMVAMLDGTLKTRGGRTRGAGKVVSGKKKGKLSSGKAVEQVTEMIEGKGALVRVISLDHR
jgi:hypothetical protein